jgi:hypothetical protein
MPGIEHRDPVAWLIAFALPLVFTAYAIAVWEGHLWRRRLIRDSRRWLFWSVQGKGLFTVYSLWVALAFDILIVPSAVLAAFDIRGDFADALSHASAALGAALFLFSLLAPIAGPPAWSLPPWFVHARARTARRAHVATVNYVSAVSHGTKPYYVALCSCGWVGRPIGVDDAADARSESLEDARRHTPTVRKRVVAPLDPLPR